MANRRAAGLDVHAAHPVFTTNYLQHAYRVSRDAVTAFFNGRPVTPRNAMRILAAIIDDTPDAATPCGAASPCPSPDSLPLAVLLAKAILCDQLCAVINAHRDV